jgi:hypothetical protein
LFCLFVCFDLFCLFGLFVVSLKKTELACHSTIIREGNTCCHISLPGQ